MAVAVGDGVAVGLVVGLAVGFGVLLAVTVGVGVLVDVVVTTVMVTEGAGPNTLLSESRSRTKVEFSNWIWAGLPVVERAFIVKVANTPEPVLGESGLALYPTELPRPEGRDRDSNPGPLS